MNKSAHIVRVAVGSISTIIFCFCYWLVLPFPFEGGWSWGGGFHWLQVSYWPNFYNCFLPKAITNATTLKCADYDDFGVREMVEGYFHYAHYWYMIVFMLVSLACGYLTYRGLAYVIATNRSCR
jgi:hypothetical protein